MRVQGGRIKDPRVDGTTFHEPVQVPMYSIAPEISPFVARISFMTSSTGSS